MIKDNGDIIRGLGFLALYSAYLEEQIDNILLSLEKVVPVSERELRWQVSNKIKYIKKGLKQIELEYKEEIVEILNICKEVFEDRNELIHGRIYSDFGRSYELRSGRYNTPVRKVKSDELISLANEINELLFVTTKIAMFIIPKAIQNKSA